MVNVEEQDPAPFIELMNNMGLVTRIKDEHGDRVLDPVREQLIREPEKKQARA
ncbi:saccharopine dehydrogenase family protein [Oligella ureolytica]